jgi:hypothetical protein
LQAGDVAIERADADRELVRQRLAAYRLAMPPQDLDQVKQALGAGQDGSSRFGAVYCKTTDRRWQQQRQEKDRPSVSSPHEAAADGCHERIGRKCQRESDR